MINLIRELTYPNQSGPVGKRFCPNTSFIWQFSKTPLGFSLSHLEVERFWWLQSLLHIASMPELQVTVCSTDIYL